MISGPVLVATEASSAVDRAKLRVVFRGAFRLLSKKLGRRKAAQMQAISMKATISIGAPYSVHRGA
jgi:hypothetical protein